MNDDGAAGKIRRGGRWGCVLACAVGLVLIGTASGGVWWWMKSSERAAGEIGELPPVTKTHFLNANARVAYVGTQKCVECHEDEHQSWLHTSHSRALADIAVDREPPDGEVAHPLSGRKYRVYRQDGQLRHQELTLGSQPLTLADHPIQYVIGSGSYSRSYLLELDGFLVESPVTWYAKKQEWGMSPGYGDSADQPGFARAAEYACVRCHVGRVTALQKSLHRLRIEEQSIGCERCHGPGELHVRRHQGSEATDTAEDEADLTIVNPRRLDRRRQESICGQCHLTNLADIELRGRSQDDFRPGMLLSDFRVGFRLAAADSAMTVVGHMEQMRLSRCYTETESLTCTTCHDPHRPVEEAAKAKFYRAKCLECHTGEAMPTDGAKTPAPTTAAPTTPAPNGPAGQSGRPCGLAEAKRLEQVADDNCVTCHMPRTDTEINHFAFNHHRIGIHSSTTASLAAPQRTRGGLEAVDEIEGLSGADQLRNLGLAYMEIVLENRLPDATERFQQLARTHLGKAHQAGLRDAPLLAALAQLWWTDDPERTIQLATAALEQPRLSPKTRHNAMTVLGATYFQLGQYNDARRILQQVTTVRRAPEDWYMLAVCEQQAGRLDEALKAIRQAAAIDPFKADWETMQAELLEQLGRPEEARRHAQRAQQLENARR